MPYLTKLLICAGAVLSLFPRLEAEDRLTVTSTLVTAYITRGCDILDHTPAYQPSVEYSLPELNINLSVWSSFSLTRRSESSFTSMDELDLTASYSTNIGNTAVCAGIIRYDWFQDDDWPDQRTTTWEPFITFERPDYPFSPSLEVYYDFNEKVGDGIFAMLSFSRGIFEQAPAPLDLTLSAGYTDQIWKSESGICDINLTISSELASAHMTAAPQFTLTYTPDKDLMSDQLVFWAGFGIIWNGIPNRSN